MDSQVLMSAPRALVQKISLQLPGVLLRKVSRGRFALYACIINDLGLTIRRHKATLSSSVLLRKLYRYYRSCVLRYEHPLIDFSQTSIVSADLGTKVIFNMKVSPIRGIGCLQKFLS